jgi:hypothetical protein
MQRLAWRTTDIDDTLKFSREVCHNGRFFAQLRTAITPCTATADAVDQATSVLQQNRHSRASALLQLIRETPVNCDETQSS